MLLCFKSRACIRKGLTIAPYIMMMASALFIRNHRHRTHVRRSLLTIHSSLDDIMNEVLNVGNFSQYQFSTIDNNKISGPEDWLAVDWNREGQHVVASPPSPVDQVWIRDRPVYIKRDDQLRLPGSQLSGNKARKMLTLTCMQEFPECIVSYGGPQSNAMLALAAVVHFQNQKTSSMGNKKRFVYYTKKLPRFLRSQPSGNLFRALLLGMELVEVSVNDYNDLFGGDFGGSPEPPKNLPPPIPGKSIWIPQGGACGVAVAGAEFLAEEIISYWRDHGRGRPLTVAVPGGTCSTAVLLHNAIRSLQNEQTAADKLDIKVLVVPCVGDDGYARRQMTSLLSQIRQTGTIDDVLCDLPEILPPYPEDLSGLGRSNTEQYVTFGTPDASVLDVYREIKDECDFQLDLLYGASAWTVLLRHWRSESLWASSEHPTSANFQGRQLMYVHSGGLEGINSQLLRYHYKGLVSIEDVQY